MDILEDTCTTIILGRPCLATTGAIIDVNKGKLSFEVGDEKVEFIFPKSSCESSPIGQCHQLDSLVPFEESLCSLYYWSTKYGYNKS